MADFYAARSSTMPPLTWTNFAPPFSAMTPIETAKMIGLDPQAYLTDVLGRIHDHKINRLDELLLWNRSTEHRNAAAA